MIRFADEMDDQPPAVGDRSSDENQMSADLTGRTDRDEGPVKDDTLNFVSTLSQGLTSSDNEHSSRQEREQVKDVIETTETSAADLRIELELIKAEKRAMAEEIKSLLTVITGSGKSLPEIPVSSADIVTAPISSPKAAAAPESFAEPAQKSKM